MKNRFAVLLLLVLAACSRDQRDVIPLSECGTTWVELVPLDLKTHEDFDRLDQVLLRQGTAADMFKVYADLAAVAPEDRTIRFRSAFASLVVDPFGRGPRIASDAIRWLGPGPDADFLSILLERRPFFDAEERVTIPMEQRDAAAALAGRITAFVAANPGWKGPMGWTVEDVRDMGNALESEGR